jgi:uncharacterized protein (TIGR02266 family)
MEVTPMASREPRYSVSINVDYSTRDMFLASRVTNLSRGGLFIESRHPLPIQSEIDLTFTLPEFQITICAKGRVVWNYDMRKGTHRLITGSGIRFTDISPEHRMILEAYLEKLARGVAVAN